MENSNPESTNSPNLYDYLYEQRVLVFMERGDYTGFNQVLLTGAQFKAMTETIGTLVEKKGDKETVSIELDEEYTVESKVFEGMTSHG